MSMGAPPNAGNVSAPFWNFTTGQWAIRNAAGQVVPSAPPAGYGANGQPLAPAGGSNGPTLGSGGTGSPNPGGTLGGTPPTTFTPTVPTPGAPTLAPPIGQNPNPQHPGTPTPGAPTLGNPTNDPAKKKAEDDAIAAQKAREAAEKEAKRLANENAHAEAEKRMPHGQFKDPGNWDAIQGVRKGGLSQRLFADPLTRQSTYDATDDGRKAAYGQVVSTMADPDSAFSAWLANQYNYLLSQYHTANDQDKELGFTDWLTGQPPPAGDDYKGNDPARKAGTAAAPLNQRETLTQRYLNLPGYDQGRGTGPTGFAGAYLNKYGGR